MGLFRHEPSMEDFSTDNWKRLSEEQRLSSLQMLENQMAAVQGRESRKIYADYGMENGLCGSYKNREIYIKGDYLSSKEAGIQYDAMNTVIHEGRHAYQDDCVWDAVANPPDRGTVDLWEKNQKEDVYISSSDKLLSFSYYRFQPMERDANDFADQTLSILESHFKNDPEYNLYMKERTESNNDIMLEAVEKHGVDYLSKIDAEILNRYQEKYVGKKGSSSEDDSLLTYQNNSFIEQNGVHSKEQGVHSEEKAGIGKSDVGNSEFSGRKDSGLLPKPEDPGLQIHPVPKSELLGKPPQDEKAFAPVSLDQLRPKEANGISGMEGKKDPFGRNPEQDHLLKLSGGEKAGGLGM